MALRSDVRIITALEPNATEAILEGYATGGTRLGDTTLCSRCDQSVGQRESDPSMMLGVVFLLAANTLIVAALVAAVVWIVA